MKRILYLGNKLSKYGYTPTSVETLGGKLSEHFLIYSASSEKRSLARLRDMLWTLWKLRKKIDFLIIDTYSSWAFYYALLSSQLARFLKIPFVPLLHGGDLPKRFESSPFFCKLIFEYSYRNVTPSGYLQNALKKKGYAATIIPNFIELKNYPFTERVIIRPKLLWVRSFHKVYNGEMAVKVLSLLLKNYPEAELCMVGPDKDGSLKIVEDLAIELGIRDKIKFTGKLPKEEWIALSTNYDVFINTTNFDNTPVSVIEAKGLGLPVVSTNAGGLPWVIKNEYNGFLVNMNDVRQMAEVINSLIDQPQLAKQTIENAREQVKAFDVEAVLRTWKELLE